MKKYFTIFFSLLFALLMSQNKIPSSKSIQVNFFTYKYKYLDSNFNIKIPDEEFQKAIIKYKFYPERVIGQSYKDSLLVVLADEFSDDHMVNSAGFQLSYSWLRLSYHLLITAEECQKLGKKYEFKHPYLFQKYLSNDKNHDAYLKRLFIHLREKVFKLTKDEKVKTMNAYQLMNVALRNSPQRIEDFQILAFERKHGYKPNKNTKLGEGCGKENCCQTQKAK